MKTNTDTSRIAKLPTNIRTQLLADRAAGLAWLMRPTQRPGRCTECGGNGPHLGSGHPFTRR